MYVCDSKMRHYHVLLIEPLCLNYADVTTYQAFGLADFVTFQDNSAIQLDMSSPFKHNIASLGARTSFKKNAA